MYPTRDVFDSIHEVTALGMGRSLRVLMRMMEEYQHNYPMLIQLQKEHVVLQWADTFKDLYQLTAAEITALGQFQFTWCESLSQDNRREVDCPRILECRLCQYIWLCNSNEAIPKPSIIIDGSGVSHNLSDHAQGTASNMNSVFKDIMFPCLHCVVCQDLRDKIHIVDHDSCCCCHLCCYP